MNSGKAGRNRQVVLTLTPEVEVGLSLPSWMSTLHRFSVAYEGPALAKSTRAAATSLCCLCQGSQVEQFDFVFGLVWRAVPLSLGRGVCTDVQAEKQADAGS